MHTPIKPEVVYFEMNNWFAGRDYPDDEPFLTWFAHNPRLQFYDRNWVAEHKLVVVTHLVDMAVNFLVTAPKEWVEKTCPKLLTDYKKFLCYPDKEGVVEGQFGTKFMKWSPANVGVHEVDYNYWKDEDFDDEA